MGSTSVREVLGEARGLVTRLHERDRLADGIVASAHGLAEKLNCMREYQEDLNELATSSGAPPASVGPGVAVTSRPTALGTRSALIASLQQENRQIRHLEAENRRLQTTLEEYEAGLELIMERHRAQMAELSEAGQAAALVKTAFARLQPPQDAQDDAARSRDFAALFAQCLAEGEAASHADAEELSRLRTENRTLRHLLLAAAPNDPTLLPAFAAQRGGLLEDPPPREGECTPTAPDLSPVEEAKGLPNGHGTAGKANGEPPAKPSTAKAAPTPTAKATKGAPAAAAPKKPVVNGTAPPQGKKGAAGRPSAARANGPLTKSSSGENGGLKASAKKLLTSSASVDKPPAPTAQPKPQPKPQPTAVS